VYYEIKEDTKMSSQQEPYLRIAELERVLENILEQFDDGCIESMDGELVACTEPLQDALYEATTVLYREGVDVEE
jgi:hypothetical protein